MKNCNGLFKITVFVMAVTFSIIFVSSCSKTHNETEKDYMRDQQEASDVSEYTTYNGEVELSKNPFDSTSSEEISQPETTVPTETTTEAEETAPPQETAVDSEVNLPKIPF